MKLNDLKRIVRKGRIREEEPMRLHTSFRTGGPAAVFATPAGIEEAADLIRYLNRNGLPYFILGNGTNLLVSDEGYEGCVVDLGRNDGTEFTMLGIEEDDSGVLFDAGAGCLLSSIGSFALKYAAAGFEPLSGIPGCVGGACVMNAGAYGGEIRDVLKNVTVITREGEIEVLPAEDLELGYRSSSLPARGLTVARAEFSLRKGDPEMIRARMEELLEKRRDKQPLNLPSAGSTFKRPEGYFAGKLIEEAGLRGFALGGAQVSEKHCGFLVNRGGASSADICRLIQYVQKTVFERSGVRLEPEIKFLGRFEADEGR